MARLIIFFIVNFLALGLGSYLMGSTPLENTWYQSLNKAPWTPPGWVFGAAWTSIMICFSIFMWKATDNPNALIYILFIIQFVLNVIWNPIFFRWHMLGFSMIIICSLTLLVLGFTYWGFRHRGTLGLFMLPYMLWLLIAVSLNAYAYVQNK